MRRGCGCAGEKCARAALQSIMYYDKNGAGRDNEEGLAFEYETTPKRIKGVFIHDVCKIWELGICRTLKNYIADILTNYTNCH